MPNDTDMLRPFKPTNFPADPVSQQRFLPEQDKLISNCLTSIIEVMKKLEARMNAAGI
jgi:hypothetical protein